MCRLITHAHQARNAFKPPTHFLPAAKRVHSKAERMHTVERTRANGYVQTGCREPATRNAAKLAH